MEKDKLRVVPDKSELDDRSYLFIKLANELDVLLVSDPVAEMVFFDFLALIFG